MKIQIPFIPILVCFHFASCQSGQNADSDTENLTQTKTIRIDPKSSTSFQYLICCYPQISKFVIKNITDDQNYTSTSKYFNFSFLLLL